MSHDADQVCPCTADHRPVVMENTEHHIRPLYLGGADSPDNRVFVCPTTHYNTHEIIRFLILGQTTFPGASRYARDLAIEGVRRWREGTHGA